MMKLQFFLAAMTQLPVAEVFTVPSLLFYAICILTVVIMGCCVVSPDQNATFGRDCFFEAGVFTPTPKKTNRLGFV